MRTPTTCMWVVHAKPDYTRPRPSRAPAHRVTLTARPRVGEILRNTTRLQTSNMLLGHFYTHLQLSRRRTWSSHAPGNRRQRHATAAPTRRDERRRAHGRRTSNADQLSHKVYAATQPRKLANSSTRPLAAHSPVLTCILRASSVCERSESMPLASLITPPQAYRRMRTAASAANTSTPQEPQPRLSTNEHAAHGNPTHGPTQRPIPQPEAAPRAY